MPAKFRGAFRFWVWHKGHGSGGHGGVSRDDSLCPVERKACTLSHAPASTTPIQTLQRKCWIQARAFGWQGQVLKRSLP